jgi:cysteine-S-conjugate beta-lyase
VYPPFLTAPANWRRRLVTVPLVQTTHRWEIDFDRLTEAITPRTRLFLLCSPHNPVGRAYSREELATLAAICEEHQLIICSDEIHCGLILDQDKAHIPTAMLSREIADRTVTLMAPSKTFNLPGLGCSFAIISNAEVRHRFREAMAGIVPSVNALAYCAAEAAYRDGSAWQAALLNCLRDNREIVTHAVTEMPGLCMSHVEATYLAWIDTRDANLDHPVEFFESAGVGLGNGAHFGGPGFVRLTFGCPRSMLLEGLNRMREALMKR